MPVNEVRKKKAITDEYESRRLKALPDCHVDGMRLVRDHLKTVNSREGENKRDGNKERKKT